MGNEKNDELLKKLEELETECQYWKDGYASLLEESVNLKSDYETLKNAYADDLTDVIDTLIKVRREMLQLEDYEFRHAKNEGKKETPWWI